MASFIFSDQFVVPSLLRRSIMPALETSLILNKGIENMCHSSEWLILKENCFRETLKLVAFSCAFGNFLNDDLSDLYESSYENIETEDYSIGKKYSGSPAAHAVISLLDGGNFIFLEEAKKLFSPLTSVLSTGEHYVTDIKLEFMEADEFILSVELSDE